MSIRILRRQFLPKQPIPDVGGLTGAVGGVLGDVAFRRVVTGVLECDDVCAVADPAKFSVLHVAAQLLHTGEDLAREFGGDHVEFSPAVAKVAKTIGDSSCRPKLLARSATGIFSPAARLSRSPGGQRCSQWYPHDGHEAALSRLSFLRDDCGFSLDCFCFPCIVSVKSGSVDSPASVMTDLS